MKFNPFTRRQFLVGSGGFLLSIPVLPSLLPKAFAATTAGKRFFCLGWDNGRWHEHWYPSAAESSKLVANAAAQYMREMPLSSIAGNISQTFGAQFNGAIRDKMLLVRGLDGFWRNLQGHQTSTILAGNLAAAQAHGDTNMYESKFGPSIDYVMAKNIKSNPNMANPNSYVNLGVRNGWDISYRYDAGTNRQIPVGRTTSPAVAFNALFANVGGNTPPPVNNRNQKVVDLVYQNYSSVVNSRKLARDEKLVLQEHMQTLSELQASIAANTPPPATNECVKPATPGGALYSNGEAEGVGVDRVNRQNVEIMIAAAKCGIVNIGTIMLSNHVDNTVFANLGLSAAWHDGYSHNRMDSPEVLKITQFITGFFGQFINGLNTPEPGTNGTYLDNSLVYFGNAMGHGTDHSYSDMPVVMAGGLSGKIKTGRYIDYSFQGQGRNYCAFLAMIMTAMGLSPADYQQPNVSAGFGSDTVGGYTTNAPPAWAAPRTPLPGILV